MRPSEHYDRVARKYSEMISSGLGGRLKNRERDCLMYLLSPKSTDVILDAGCGSGFYANMIRKSGAQVFCIDVSSVMVEVAKESGLDAEVHDVQSMNLNRKFGKILCAGPIEFCNSPLEALRNLRRHLTGEGCIVLSILNISVMGIVYWLYHFSHGIRINLYSLRGIKELLSNAGFRIEMVERPTSFLFAIKAAPNP
ncbi:MAG: methyltransferase domain-containing protein [archaeon]